MTNLPPAPSPPHLLEAAVYCPDLDAAESFYGGVMGLQRIVRVQDRHVFYRVGAGVLLIFNPDLTVEPPGNPDLPVPPHGARGPGHVCLAMPGDGLPAWRARFLAAGVKIDADFTWPGGARSLYVRDPAGKSVELAEPRLWA